MYRDRLGQRQRLDEERLGNLQTGRRRGVVEHGLLEELVDQAVVALARDLGPARVSRCNWRAQTDPSRTALTNADSSGFFAASPFAVALADEPDLAALAATSSGASKPSCGRALRLGSARDSLSVRSEIWDVV